MVGIVNVENESSPVSFALIATAPASPLYHSLSFQAPIVMACIPGDLQRVDDVGRRRLLPRHQHRPGELVRLVPNRPPTGPSSAPAIRPRREGTGPCRSGRPPRPRSIRRQSGPSWSCPLRLLYINPASRTTGSSLPAPSAPPRAAPGTAPRPPSTPSAPRDGRDASARPSPRRSARGFEASESQKNRFSMPASYNAAALRR